MADTKRRRTVSTTYGDDNTISLAIYARPDDMGAQAIVETLTFAAADVADALQVRLLLAGVSSLIQNAYNKLDNPDAPEVKTVVTAVLQSLRDGSWQPGRQFDTEPTDLEVALAEATAKPLHVVQHWMEEQLALVKKTADGSVAKDKGGRVIKVHRRSDFLDKIAADPRVKPILARLLREKAAKLAAEARTDKSAPTDTFGGLFDAPAAAAAE